MYLFQLPKMKAIFMYHEHTLIRKTKFHTLLFRVYKIFEITQNNRQKTGGWPKIGSGEKWVWLQRESDKKRVRQQKRAVVNFFIFVVIVITKSNTLDKAS